MTEPTHLAAIYNAAQIILWVEDLVTSAYLGAIWRHDKRLQFCVGGGHENLASVVEYARRSGRRSVFCLRDRDFGPTNRQRWGAPDVFVFTLETFEIECFLLDPAALAQCVDINTAGRSEQDIRDRFADQASRLLWWMACRKVLADLREARQMDFPPHPKRSSVSTRDAAADVLLNNDWVRTTAPELKKRVEAARLLADLDAAHKHYEHHLKSGTWTGVFSGKEILVEGLSWIWTRGREKSGSPLEDLAKAVASQQLKAGRAPSELIELHAVLVARGTSP